MLNHTLPANEVYFYTLREASIALIKMENIYNHFTSSSTHPAALQLLQQPILENFGGITQELFAESAPHILHQLLTEKLEVGVTEEDREVARKCATILHDIIRNLDEDAIPTMHQIMEGDLL